MSADVRQKLKDLLEFQPEEDLPCTQVLGIGLTEEICEDDEALHRWLLCKSLDNVQDRGMALEEAIADAFDRADDQCEFFELELPVERQRSFGPLEAQIVREERREEATEQAELPGAAEAEEPAELRPQRAEPDAGEQAGLGGVSRRESVEATEAAEERQRRRERRAEREREAGQATFEAEAEEPARLSEFEGDDGDEGNGNGGDGGGDDREGFGPEFSLVPDLLEGDTLVDSGGLEWRVQRVFPNADELQVSRPDRLQGFPIAEMGDMIRNGEWLLKSRAGWDLRTFQLRGAQSRIVWEDEDDRNRTIQLQVRGGDWQVRRPDGGRIMEPFTLGEAAQEAFDIMAEEIDSDDTVTITARDPETGETETVEFPREVNNWRYNPDAPEFRGTVVWESLVDPERFVAWEKTGGRTWAALLKDDRGQQEFRTASDPSAAIQIAIDLMEDNSPRPPGDSGNR